MIGLDLPSGKVLFMWWIATEGVSGIQMQILEITNLQYHSFL